MQTETTCELPDSFDGIQFGAVRGKKIQVKLAGLFLAPPLMGSRMMVGGVIRNDHYAFTGKPTGLTQLLQERKKTVAVEFLRFQAKHKASIAETYRPEITHAFACGSVEQNGILDFRWYPHTTA
jgi:hypothetical protein